MPTKSDTCPVPHELPADERESLRKLPFDGAANFRDIGGYAASEGRTIRWGLLYRSDHLGKLSSRDEEYLGRLGIRKITDFRGPSEREERPNRVPEGILLERRPIDVAGPDAWEKFESYIRGKIDIDPKQYMHDVNRLFATEYTAVYREWLRDIIDGPDSLPQVFHCTAGKDRTGFAAAVLMRLLGVSPETIMDDYLKTNAYIAEANKKLVKKIRAMSMFRVEADLIRSLLGVERAYLETAFSAIDGHWGGFDAYVRDGLKLTPRDIAALGDLLLE